MYRPDAGVWQLHVALLPQGVQQGAAARHTEPAHSVQLELGYPRARVHSSFTRNSYRYKVIF